MSNQPEATRWACLLEREAAQHGATDYKHKAAAELRRLHALNVELLEVAKLALRMGVYGGVSPSTVEDAARAALAQPRQFTFAPRPPSPPPAPGGYDGTEAGLHSFSWRNNE